MKELELNSAARTPINWLPLVLPLPSNPLHHPVISRVSESPQAYCGLQPQQSSNGAANARPQRAAAPPCTKLTALCPANPISQLLKVASAEHPLCSALSRLFSSAFFFFRSLCAELMIFPLRSQVAHGGAKMAY